MMEEQGQADPKTYAIIGAAMEVHRTLGCGFLEAVYQETLACEFSLRQIPFQREVALPIVYKNVQLTTSYRVDFICYSDVIVELKALSGLTTVQEALLINYLKASEIRAGLLLNFGATSLQYERRVFG